MDTQFVDSFLKQHGISISYEKIHPDYATHDWMIHHQNGSESLTIYRQDILETRVKEAAVVFTALWKGGLDVQDAMNIASKVLDYDDQYDRYNQFGIRPGDM